VTPAQEKLTKARAWLSTRLPFFAVLALHLPDREAKIETAATDGAALLYNPAYIAKLSDTEARGLLLHLVLHAAFGHAWRRGGRDAGRWETACDIVVNPVIRGVIGAAPPAGADAQNAALEGLAVEEIYALLPENLEPPTAGTTQEQQQGSSRNSGELSDYWRDAVSAAVNTGDAPGNLERHYPKVSSSISWTQVLGRHLVRAQHDYDWGRPDRRMMGHDLIYPSLAGEGVRVGVVIDTSGSVSPELIGSFLSELRALRKSHPNVSGLVIYADAAVRGVHDLERAAPPSVIGGGGTSFAPAFHELERRRFVPDVLVYLTDGEAEFPARPRFPVIWVLPGDSDVRPPWGEVLRLGVQGSRAARA
jgi:predicted metal-dependent peptidase